MSEAAFIGWHHAAHGPWKAIVRRFSEGEACAALLDLHRGGDKCARREGQRPRERGRRGQAHRAEGPAGRVG